MLALRLKLTAVFLVVVVSMSALGFAIYTASSEARARDELATTNCQRINDLNGRVRDVLVSARASARREGQLTPEGELFYERSIASLTAYEC